MPNMHRACAHMGVPAEYARGKLYMLTCFIQCVSGRVIWFKSSASMILECSLN